MIYLIQIPDPLGLDTIGARVKALRCINCGGSVVAGGICLPGEWCLLTCHTCVPNPMRVSAYTAIATLLKRMDDTVLEAVMRGANSRIDVDQVQRLAWELVRGMWNALVRDGLAEHEKASGKEKVVPFTRPKKRGGS